MKPAKILTMAMSALIFSIDLAIAQENPASYELARQILGDDFIIPDEVARARHLTYTDANFKHFADTLPSEETLRWCGANGYAVVAGPPATMNIVDIRALKPELFWSSERSWYTDVDLQKSKNVTVNWLVIRKGPIPNSVNKDWDDQYHLLSRGERVPSADEVAWLVTTFYEVRATRLFEQIHVRTSSVSPFGVPVLVGYHEGKLAFFRWGSFYKDKNIGVASCLTVRAR